MVGGIDVELVVQPREVLFDRGLGHHELGCDLTNRGGLGEEVAIEQRTTQHDEHIALANRDARARLGCAGHRPADIGGVAKEQLRGPDPDLVAVVQPAGAEDPLPVHVRTVRRTEVGDAPPGREPIEQRVETTDRFVFVDREVVLCALADRDPFARELHRAPAGDGPDLDGGAHGARA